MSVEIFLFFDSLVGGHHGEFLENVIWGVDDGNRRYIVLAHPELSERLEAAKNASGSKIELYYLSEEELSQLQSARGVCRRSQCELDLLARYVERLEPEVVVLMHLNMHQIGLAKWRPAFSVKIRGILLSPYTPISRARGFSEKLRVGITAIRKRLQIKYMLRQPMLDRVFVLNDQKVAELFNRWYPRRPIFEAIVDPLPVAVTQCEPQRFKGEVGVFRLLIAGAISRRKGVLETLKALRCLLEDGTSSVELRVVGKFPHSSYRQAVEAAAEKLLTKHGHRFSFTLIDQFVDFQELSNEFASTDCVLIPYLKFYGSSGMIGHAIYHDKPIVACDSGLIGEIVQHYGLGETVDPQSEYKFADCLRLVMQEKLNERKGKCDRVVARRKFATDLPENWLG
jgi:glycosyltransferase involved in cell wall biosynthesis